MDEDDEDVDAAAVDAPVLEPDFELVDAPADWLEVDPLPLDPLLRPDVDDPWFEWFEPDAGVEALVDPWPSAAGVSPLPQPRAQMVTARPDTTGAK